MALVFILFSCLSILGCSPGSDVFRVLVARPALSLDPVRVDSVQGEMEVSALFPGLLTLDARTGSIRPLLAESWTVDEDRRTYRFQLARRQWSDGKPVSATDVRESWLRMMDPRLAAPFGWIPASFIQGGRRFYQANPDREGPRGLAELREQVMVMAPDPLTLVVTLGSPAPRFLWALDHWSFGVLPPQVYSSSQDLALDAQSLQAGLEARPGPWGLPLELPAWGPWLYQGTQDSQTLVLRKNPVFAEARDMTLNQLEFRHSESMDTALAQWRSGQGDHLPVFTPQELDRVRDQPGLQSSPANASYYILFNLHEAPFDDPRVRQALSLCVDRQGLVSSLVDRSWAVLDSPIPLLYPLAVPAFPKPEPKAAKELLAQAGGAEALARRIQRPLSLVFNQNDQNVLVANSLAAVWRRDLGLELEVKGLDTTAYLAAQQSQDFSLLRSGWINPWLDPGSFLERFESTNAANDGAYRNEVFDHLLQQARTLDPGQEQEYMGLLVQALGVLARDWAIIPLFQYANHDLVDTRRWPGWQADSLKRCRFWQLGMAVVPDQPDTQAPTRN